jgi:DNA-binding transcriptional MocR family regulator
VTVTATTADADIHFSRGIPPAEAVPAAALAELTGALVATDAGALFQYAPLGANRGDRSLRAELARRHGAAPDEVFVGNGSLQVLDLLARRLLDREPPGRAAGGRPHVIVEAPTYDRARQIFERHGATPVAVPVERDGLDVAALAGHLAAGPPPALLYTIPDFQNPSGVTLSAPKRRALLDLAAAHGVVVVEDSPYRDLRYHGEAPPRLRDLAGPAGARVLAVGSLSKVLSPGLRVGYAVADGATAAALAADAEGTYLSPSPLCQAIAARALATGLVERNVAAVVERLRPRHDHAVAAVGEELGDRARLLAVPGGGYYLGLHVPLAAGLDEAGLRRRAAERGLVLAAGAAFHPATPPGTAFVRVPFQSLAPGELREGLRRLRRAAGPDGR